MKVSHVGRFRPIIDAGTYRIIRRSANLSASTVHKITAMLQLHVCSGFFCNILHSVFRRDKAPFHCKLCHHVFMEEISDGNCLLSMLTEPETFVWYQPSVTAWHLCLYLVHIESPKHK
jgi:hypothetical protein